MGMGMWRMKRFMVDRRGRWVRLDVDGRRTVDEGI